MTRRHDQQCTGRKDDWLDLLHAIMDMHAIGHELKNVVFEEWRRWTGKCPKQDEHEGGV